MSELTITPQARKWIIANSKKEGKDCIAFGVKSSGCSGFRYDVNFITEEESEDKSAYLYTDTLVDNDHAVFVFIEHSASSYLHGMSIELARDPQGLSTTLSFVNPNEKASCGCGESISF